MRLHELSRPERRPDAKRVLLAAGYQQIGFGGNAHVFRKPGASYVLKVFDNSDRAFLAFVTLAQSHPNRHFPKFIGRPVKVTETYSAIRVEPLQPLTTANWGPVYTYIGYHDKRDELSKDEYYRKSIARADEYMATHPELKEACDLIIKYLLGTFQSDLHEGNVMQRGDELVIIDPVVVHAEERSDW